MRCEQLVCTLRCGEAERANVTEQAQGSTHVQQQRRLYAVRNRQRSVQQRQRHHQRVRFQRRPAHFGRGRWRRTATSRKESVLQGIANWLKWVATPRNITRQAVRTDTDKGDAWRPGWHSEPRRPIAGPSMVWRSSELQ